MINIKKTIIILGVLITIGLVGFFVTRKTDACPPEPECESECLEYEQVCPVRYFDYQGQCWKMICSGHSCYWDIKDYEKGECLEWSTCPTPTPTPEPTETPTSTPEITPTQEVTPTPEITPEPTATPSAIPTEQPKRSFEMGGAPQCFDDGAKYAPTITRLWRDSTGKNVDTEWTETDTNDFVIYYGPTGQDLLWNTGRIIGNSTVIHLESSQMIDAIACSLSPCGVELCGTRVVDP